MLAAEGGRRVQCSATGSGSSGLFDVDDLIDLHEGEELVDIGLNVAENEATILLTRGLDAADKDADTSRVHVPDVLKVEENVARAGRELESQSLLEVASVGDSNAIDVDGGDDYSF